MSEMVLVTKSLLDDIAIALASKREEVGTKYTLSEMPGKILGIANNFEVEVLGAPNSTVYWVNQEDNTKNGSFELTNGTGSCVLPAGTYSFTNIVTLSKSLFYPVPESDKNYTTMSKIVGINSNKQIELYPEHMIYWYGRSSSYTIDNGNEYTLSGWGRKQSATELGNCVSSSASSTYQTSIGIAWGTHDKINTVGYTKIYIRYILNWDGGSNNRQSKWGLLPSSRTLDNNNNFAIKADDGNTTLDGLSSYYLNITDIQGDYYLAGYAGVGYQTSGTTYISILAIWLE